MVAHATAETLDEEEVGRSRAAAVLSVLLILVLFGGVIAAVRGSMGTPAPAMTMGGGRDPGPISLESMTPTVAAMYRHAADHQDVYERVPCYCGCDSFADHRNLYDCFLRTDGAGYEAHGAGCAICQAEAREVQRLSASGRSGPEIRADVIDQFGPATDQASTSGT